MTVCAFNHACVSVCRHACRLSCPLCPLFVCAAGPCVFVQACADVSVSRRTLGVRNWREIVSESGQAWLAPPTQHPAVITQTKDES